MRAPHLVQELVPGGFSSPHLAQTTPGFVFVVIERDRSRVRRFEMIVGQPVGHFDCPLASVLVGPGPYSRLPKASRPVNRRDATRYRQISAAFTPAKLSAAQVG